MKIKIAIVDDHPLVIQGIISFLERYSEFDIISGAGNGKEFITTLEEGVPPDIVILDLEMPEMDGEVTALYLQNNYPEIKPLILTTHDSELYACHLMEKGARGYLIKGAQAELLAEALFSIYETGYYFNEFIRPEQLELLWNGKSLTPKYRSNSLSEREMEIVSLLCNQYSNKEMAEILSLGIRTIESHRKHIMEKIGAKNGAGIIIYGLENSLKTKFGFKKKSGKK